MSFIKISGPAGKVEAVAQTVSAVIKEELGWPATIQGFYADQQEATREGNPDICFVEVYHKTDLGDAELRARIGGRITEEYKEFGAVVRVMGGGDWFANGERL